MITSFKWRRPLLDEQLVHKPSRRAWWFISRSVCHHILRWNVTHPRFYRGHWNNALNQNLANRIAQFWEGAVPSRRKEYQGKSSFDITLLSSIPQVIHRSVVGEGGRAMYDKSATPSHLSPSSPPRACALRRYIFSTRIQTRIDAYWTQIETRARQIYTHTLTNSQR